jgi:hypothetical protein
MNIKETISIINQMQADGVIGKYAIGGAVGATFYLEPADTQDIDIFITLGTPVERSIITLTPIYDYLKNRGCQIAGGHIVVAGWPVQFLPAESLLLKEALDKSLEKYIENMPVHVFSPEHLAAIALQLGRPKDKLRLLQFVEANVLNESDFSAILARHELLENWSQFKRKMSG